MLLLIKTPSAFLRKGHNTVGRFLARCKVKWGKGGCQAFLIVLKFIHTGKQWVPCKGMGLVPFLQKNSRNLLELVWYLVALHAHCALRLSPTPLLSIFGHK